VSVYSLRARQRPTVSTPVTWDEVERAYKKKDASVLVFESHQVLDRIEKIGDLYAPLLTLKQKLPKFAGIESGRAEAISSGVKIAAQADRKPAKSAAKTAHPKTARRQKV
jgi:bifunctional non-homologous end joining protein LigD